MPESEKTHQEVKKPNETRREEKGGTHHGSHSGETTKQEAEQDKHEPHG